MSQKKLKVLFLDDETDFLEMAQNVMQSFAGDSWEIYTARNAGEALATIQDKQIDLERGEIPGGPPGGGAPP